MDNERTVSMDEELLIDFSAWREGRILNGIDVSPQAYIAERTARDNAKRIEDVSEFIEDALYVLRSSIPATDAVEWAKSILSEVRDKLLYEQGVVSA